MSVGNNQLLDSAWRALRGSHTNIVVAVKVPKGREVWALMTPLEWLGVGGVGGGGVRGESGRAGAGWGGGGGGCREDDGAITVQLLRPVLLVLHGSPAQVASTVSVLLGFSLGEYLHL